MYTLLGRPDYDAEAPPPGWQWGEILERARGEALPERLVGKAGVAPVQARVEGVCRVAALEIHSQVAADPRVLAKGVDVHRHLAPALPHGRWRPARGDAAPADPAGR